MPIVKYILSDGNEQSVDVPVGWTVMDAARRDGVPGIVAECGGGAICGTCHVRVDPDFFQKIDAADGPEAALLQIVPESSETSRLACQIVMSEDLEGLVVEIPTEQLDF